MEAKKMKARKRMMYDIPRRMVSFLLAAAMVLTNVGTELDTAFAAESSETVTFLVSGSQLVKAVDEAIADGNEVKAGDLEFTNGKMKEFEEYFFDENRGGGGI